MYEIEGDPVSKPALPGEVEVAMDADAVIDSVATDLVAHAANCVRQFGDFHLALSGHARYVPLFRRLMYDPQFRWLPWRRTHLWLVEDEVHGDEAGRQIELLRDFIGEHADLPEEQIHAMSLHDENPAASYEAHVRDVLAWREKGQDRFDYVLLAMEPDGRCAGLFAQSPVLSDTARLYLPWCDGPQNMVSMTAAFLDAARFVAVTAVGAECADVVRRMATGDETIATLPALGITPLEGELKWYLDLNACPPE